MRSTATEVHALKETDTVSNNTLLEEVNLNSNQQTIACICL